MDIYYLGHSSFRIKGKTQTLITDPYSPETGLKFPKVEADLVTVSHDHFDHNNVAGVSGVKKVFDRPGEYETQGVSLIGISSFHDAKKGDERGKNTIFVLEMDGLRLCHLGDLGQAKLTESQIETIGDIDILMIPTGGVYTLEPAQAAELVSEIQPKLVLPMHFHFPSAKGDLTKLKPVENFISALGITPSALPKFSVKAGELLEGETTKVILLEKK